MNGRESGGKIRKAISREAGLARSPLRHRACGVHVVLLIYRLLSQALFSRK